MELRLRKFSCSVTSGLASRKRARLRTQKSNSLARWFSSLGSIKAFTNALGTGSATHRSTLSPHALNVLQFLSPLTFNNRAARLYTIPPSLLSRRLTCPLHSQRVRRSPTPRVHLHYLLLRRRFQTALISRYSNCRQLLLSLSCRHSYRSKRALVKCPRRNPLDAHCPRHLVAATFSLHCLSRAHLPPRL